MPADGKACKRKGRCPAIFISWSIPSDLSIADFNHYVMIINGHQFSHQEPTYTAHNISCNSTRSISNNISIQAVDRCRNKGAKRIFRIPSVQESLGTRLILPDCDPLTNYQTKGNKILWVIRVHGALLQITQ